MDYLPFHCPFRPIILVVSLLEQYSVEPVEFLVVFANKYLYMMVREMRFVVLPKNFRTITVHKQLYFVWPLSPTFSKWSQTTLLPRLMFDDIVITKKKLLLKRRNLNTTVTYWINSHVIINLLLCFHAIYYTITFKTVLSDRYYNIS